MPKFLQLTSEPPNGFTELMKNTLWGSSGGFRYLQTDIADRLQEQEESYFLSLIRGDNLIGTMNTYVKPSHLGEIYYIRYFSFLAGFQSVNPKSGRIKKEGIIRREINSLFHHGSLRSKGNPASFFAFVETENERSRHMCEAFGFIPRRSLSTTLFTRLNPRESSGVRRIKQEEVTTIRNKLDDYYSSYTLHNSNGISSENYYVLENDGNTLCGVRVLPVEWKIASVPGLWGWAMIRLLPRLPYFSRILDPKRFKFLAVDQIFVENGSESMLDELFESICNKLSHHFILSWSDSDSAIHSVLNKVNKGLLGNFRKNEGGQIIFRHSSVEPDVVHRLENSPMYIDPRDMT